MDQATAFLDGFIPTPEPTPAVGAVMGRPRSDYNEEIAIKICDLVAGGKTVRQIGARDGMPSCATIRRWIKENEDFRRAYLAAKEGLIEDILERVIDTAEDTSEDYEPAQLAEGDEKPAAPKPNKETLGRAQLKIDTYFRVIAKMAPRKYGDKADEPDVPPAGAPGDDAKLINPQPVVIENHPLHESILAWRRAREEFRAK